MPRKIATNCLVAAMLLSATTASASVAFARAARPPSVQHAATSAISSGGTTAGSRTSHKRRQRQSIASLNGISLATWFGPGFFGNHTACGQVLSKKIVGVANRTLPCGTLIKLSYRGKQIVAPVIDRGPYGLLHANWDLTQQAAQLLGISQTVRVHAHIVGKVSNTPDLGSPPEPEPHLISSPSAAELAGATGGASA